MTTPEAITEDREPTFPCECVGDITLLKGVWVCGKCGKEYEMMGWISVRNKLPKIKHGCYSVRVWIAMYDFQYAEIAQDKRDAWTVTDAIYGYTAKNEHYKNSKIKLDFMEFYGDGSFGPTSDPVYFWTYYPPKPNFVPDLANVEIESDIFYRKNGE